MNDNNPFMRARYAIMAGFVMLLVFIFWPQLMPVVDSLTANLTAMGSMSPTESFMMTAYPYIILLILMAGLAWVIWRAVRGTGGDRQ